MTKSLMRVAVVGYNRIPFARQNTFYRNASNHDMMVAAINGLIDRYNLQGLRLGEVAGGAVIKHSSEFSLMRETVLSTSLNPETPACDIQQACDTGIEAAIYVANKIAVGQIESGIAGGVDSTSNIPLVLDETLRQTLLDARRTKTVFGKLSHFMKLRPHNFIPVAPGINERRTGLSMGEHTEVTARHYNIGREEQDMFALQSHQRLSKAYEEGFFVDMISPYQDLQQDGTLRRDTSLDRLSKLKPVFAKDGGTLTAGNSTPFSDGASCVLLANEAWADKHSMPVLAYITFAEVAAIEFVQQRQNLLLAPIYAATRMLQKARMRLDDFDFFEIHEAFAAQVLATIKIWESQTLMREFAFHDSIGNIDADKLNVKGGSLAAAHPFAATGGRIIATMAKLLAQKGSGRGFISICAAGGQGVTMIMER